MRNTTNLKLLRQIKGLGQSEIAEQLGISVRHYRRIESGQSFLNQDSLNRLEDLFKLPQRILLAENLDVVPDFYEAYFSNI